MIHGLRYQPDDFTPRPVYQALAHTNWLFSDTRPDPSIRIESADLRAAVKLDQSRLLTYGFRSRSGKALVAYWLGVLSRPGSDFLSSATTLKLANSGIRRPVLIDVDSGAITKLAWKNEAAGEVGPVPVRDSVMVIADASYFDWAEMPEAPSSLRLKPTNNGSFHLTWELHGGSVSGVVVERRLDASPSQSPGAAQGVRWQRLSPALPPAQVEFTDSGVSRGSGVSYRVRAINAAGESAYSNVVRSQAP
jgi:hypothetical protein